ncbi:hypothetical protein EKO04_004019 [Ascochyta lentis]|uniref:Uncharacterized protein n=1 Tax=Ascochyta lentis TaxID=205686 RepID=A0A8H7J780_9PLEO|nr:hypothetical protein EKO04_004019 [Ascochyta lentis]
MTMPTEPLSGQNENADPFVVTPPRRHSPSKHDRTTTPATPKSRSTPLHKRFLEEVRMSPGTPTTPPRTPSKSPKSSQTPIRQTLEVGQNGFYFSMEIPEKKASPVKMGRVTPSPEKEKKSEVKGGGRVRDMLRKNLFGTPTKKANLPRKGVSEDEVKMSSPKHSGDRATPSTMDITAPVTQTPKVQSSTPATAGITPAAPMLDLRKVSMTSTPSNIGHLMAGLSNKSAKVQMLPAAGTTESMPTPLRKMSERLGLNSPHVIRRDKLYEASPTRSAMVPKSEQLKSQISALDLRDTATTENGPASKSPLSEADALIAPIILKETNAIPSDGLLSQHCDDGFLRCPRDTPQIRYTEQIAKLWHAPSTALFYTGTYVQGPGIAKAVTWSGSLFAFSKQDQTYNASLPYYNHGKAKHACHKAYQERRQDSYKARLYDRDCQARKPRPKSMVVGSAKVLESIASHVDSPRERAKLRSSAAAPSSNGAGPSTSRPGAASISRKPVAAITALPPSKPQDTVRTTKSAALRAAAHPKRAAPPAPVVDPRTQGQRFVSAEAIAGRVAEWKDEDRKNAAPKVPMRAKSTKAPSKPPPKPANGRGAKTPEPRDPKADSGLGQSYTPPGNPTRLPSPVKPPSKTRLVVPTTPAPKKAALPAKQRTPLPTKTPVNRRTDLRDPNAVRTPSKEIQSSLDRAIDAKIAEDARSGKEFTPSGNRISELLEAKRGSW